MREGRERGIIHCILIMGGGWGRVLHLLGSPTLISREGILKMISYIPHTHNGRGVGKGDSPVRIPYSHMREVILTGISYIAYS